MTTDRTTDEPLRSRRAILGAAAAGAAALAVARLQVPDPASAATGAMTYGADNDAGTDTTVLRSTNVFSTLEVHGSGVAAVNAQGEGPESTGVVGIGSGPGAGLRGVSDGGTGVLAESESGFGLRVDGRAGFATAGAVSVPKDKASVTVHNAKVRTSSLVIATIQRDRKDCYVRGVLVGNGSFRILLNRRVGASTKVAYFVVEHVGPLPD
jgi:hypothetical protein